MATGKFDRRVAFCVLCFSTRLASADVIDQSNDYNSAQFNFSQTIQWQQEVIAGRTGLLTGVEFKTGYVQGNSPFRFSVKLGSPWQADASEFVQDFDTPPQESIRFVDVSSANIILTAGDRFVLDWLGTGPDYLSVLGTIDPDNDLNNGRKGYYPGRHGYRATVT